MQPVRPDESAWPGVRHSSAVYVFTDEPCVVRNTVNPAASTTTTAAAMPINSLVRLFFSGFAGVYVGKLDGAYEGWNGGICCGCVGEYAG